MKRSRDVSECAGIIDENTASRLVDSIVKEWTDPCGEEYEYALSAKTGSKDIMIHVSGIPEINGDHITEAVGSSSDGVHVHSADIDFTNKQITLNVRRIVGEDKRRRLWERRGAVSLDPGREPCIPIESVNNSSQGKTKSSWMDRIIDRVDTCDQSTILDMLYLIEQWDAKNFSCDFKARLKIQPSCYIITVYGLMSLDASLLPSYTTVIYVDSGKIELIVRKSEPDV
jgi:hypothetical protein